MAGNGKGYPGFKGEPKMQGDGKDYGVSKGGKKAQCPPVPNLAPAPKLGKGK